MHSSSENRDLMRSSVRSSLLFSSSSSSSSSRRGHAARRLLSTYYDSQSGLHVSRVDGPRLHEIGPASAPDLLPLAASARLPSVALAAASASSQAESLLTAGVSPFLHAGRDTASWADHLETSAELGLGLSLEVSCGATPELDVRLASDRAVSSAVALLETAAERSVPVRVGLLDALLPGAARVELLACKLADAGADVITLVCPADDAACGDDDELEEILEGLVGSDVLGTPMADRVGLRTMCGDDGVAACERALALGVKHFDTSLSGGAAGPPHPATLARLLEEHGHAHGVDLDRLS